MARAESTQMTWLLLSRPWYGTTRGCWRLGTTRSWWLKRDRRCRMMMLSGYAETGVVTRRQSALP